MELIMPSTDSAQPATPPGAHLMSPLFEISDGRLVTPHHALLISPPYTRLSQSLLLTRIDDLISADRRKDE